MQIFLPGSHSAPDVPFRFVNVQHHTGLPGKRRVGVQKRLRHNLMHRTFTDSKFFRSLARSRAVADDVIGNADGARLNLMLQGLPP